jgi:hypothetical protein
MNKKMEEGRKKEILIHYFNFFLVLGIQLRDSCIQGKHFTTEPHPQPK